MEYGLFTMPLHPPEVDQTASYERDIETFVLADKLGYSEAWIGEHLTIPWENIPAADLFIATVLPRTERIMLGTGVVILSVHDPRDVALRIAFLDHLARGRFYFGIGSGGVPTDCELWSVDPTANEHRRRTREAIDVILKMWEEDGPYEFKGEFWQFRIPAPRPEIPLSHHIRPYQKPHPPIAVAGLHGWSETLVLAGERGWIPMSINFIPRRHLLTQWAAVEAGAQRTGRVPDRRQWRIAREIYVAESDAVAREEALNSVMRRAFEEYLRNTLGARGFLDVYKTDPEMPDEAVTAEYLVDNIWIVGSPDTVTEKIRKLYADVGGFNTLLQIAHDWNPWHRWVNCMYLFSKEVMLNLKDLVPTAEAASTGTA